jgi:hypothetical protein
VVRQRPRSYERARQAAHETAANRHERDHDGLAVWGQGFESPQLHPSEQGFPRRALSRRSPWLQSWSGDATRDAHTIDAPSAEHRHEVPFPDRVFPGVTNEHRQSPTPSAFSAPRMDPDAEPTEAIIGDEPDGVGTSTEEAPRIGVAAEAQRGGSRLDARAGSRPRSSPYVEGLRRGADRNSRQAADLCQRGRWRCGQLTLGDPRKARPSPAFRSQEKARKVSANDRSPHCCTQQLCLPLMWHQRRELANIPARRRTVSPLPP